MDRKANAAAAIFDRYRRQLLAFIARRVSAADAEDILQEVFLRFVQADAVRPVKQVAAWIFRTARNRIIDWLRKRREVPYPAARQIADDDTELLCEITTLLDDDHSPETEYLRKLVWEELEQALDELPEAQRDIFWLTEIEEFTFRELAEETGIPIATLLSRKHYAVRYLRKLADIYEALLTE